MSHFNVQEAKALRAKEKEEKKRQSSQKTKS